MPGDIGISQVAAQAGVSVGTVSNFFNRPEILAPATAAKVEQAIAALGYVRNFSARDLRLGRSRAIGLLVLDIGNPFFTDLVKGVEAAAEREGFAVILGNTGENADKELAYLELFKEQRVSGIIVSPVGEVRDNLMGFRARGIPAVLVDQESHAENFCSVSVDDLSGGRMALEHLVGLGRNDIALVSGPARIQQVGVRLLGAEQAAAAQKATRLSTYEADSFSVEAGYHVGAHLASREPGERPDAIFAANDLLAMGIMQAMVEAGIRVPDDIALVGYDDISYAGAAAVPLSSVRQPSEAMGRAAARLLLKETRTGPEHEHEQVMFAPELVVRSSSIGGGTPVP